MTSNKSTELTINERIYRDKENGALLEDLSKKYNMTGTNIQTRYRAQLKLNQLRRTSELFRELENIDKLNAYRYYKICESNDIGTLLQLARAINNEINIKQAGDKIRNVFEDLVRSKGLCTLEKSRSGRATELKYKSDGTIEFDRIISRAVKSGNKRPMIACNNKDLEDLVKKFPRFNTSNRVLVECIRTSSKVVQSLNGYNMLLTEGLVFNAVNVATNILLVQIPTDKCIRYVTYGKNDLEDECGLRVIKELEWES